MDERTRDRTAALALATCAAWSLPAPAAHVPALAGALGLARRAPLSGAVALTFDDGPHPEATPRVLDLLAAAGQRATFFLVGEQVRRHPALAAEIAAGGHAIAIHGDRHRCLLRLTPRQLADDLDRAVATIGPPAAGLHRAPYGIYSAWSLAAVRERGWQPLLWSRWGRDWRARATASSVAREATRKLRAGDVILLHDSDAYGAPGSWRTTVAALPAVLEAIVAAGLRSAALGQAPDSAPSSGR